MSSRPRGRQSKRGKPRSPRSTVAKARAEIMPDCRPDKEADIVMIAEIRDAEGCIDLSSDDDIEVAEERFADDSVVCVGSIIRSLPTEPVILLDNQVNTVQVPREEDSLIQRSLQRSEGPQTRWSNSHCEETRIKCPVCMDSDKDIKSSGRHLCSTVCGHIFCNECIHLSLQSTHQCPQCRKKLTAKQYHPLYI